ncbi:MAG TPA: hypothetical protein VJH92_05510 [Candidatus Nanoarchaeia archaeon]|nr:hypothetical protein [Candidatus Nanoarchaeia archaeon]
MGKLINGRKSNRRISDKRIRLMKDIRLKMKMPLRKIASRLRTSYQTVKIYTEYDSVSKYQQKMAKNNGFESASDYQNHLAKERGYASYHDLRVSRLQERGFGSYLDYQNHRAKECGFDSWADYLWHWKRS